MAVPLLQAHDVSDLCIGKPALRWLPPSSTVADAAAELEADAGAIAVRDGEEGSDVAGRVCMADVLLFLCAAANLASPAAALQATLSDLLAAAVPPPPPVRRIEPDARLLHVYPYPGRTATVLEAVDSLLGGAHSLVVPLRERWRRAGRGELCWLTLEDVARFFLSSIGLFSPTASRSVSDLGIVRPATLSVAAGDTALSALPLIRAAMTSHASVAVVHPDLFRNRFVGEISPSALCSCDVSVAAAFAALSVGDLTSFIGWGGAPPEAALHAVRSRLRRRNLLGMLDLLYGGLDPSSSSSSSASSSSSCSSSDDDEDDCRKGRRVTSPGARRGKRGPFSSRAAMGRRPAAEAIVCRRGSSLVAVMVQAMAHRSTHVWVVEEVEGEERELVGVVGLLDVLRVLRHHLQQPPPMVK